MAYCVHHVPGRVRFKVPKLQSDPAFAAEIEEKVRAVEGVIGVEVNRPAWSMIVHYDVDANPLDDVMEHISATRPANGANGDGGAKAPLMNGRANGSNGHYSNGHHSTGGHEMSRVVGQAIGQAIFATIVQRTLDRSLISILTGLR